MNRLILISMLSMLTLTQCSVDDSSGSQQVIKTTWHLINVTGGVAGVDQDMPLNKVIWSFNDTTSKLTITNTNTDTNIEDGFDSGDYNYSVTKNGDNDYLVIDSAEFGQLTVTETNLAINQNLTSTGSGADGFIYTFRRVNVIENVN